MVWKKKSMMDYDIGREYRRSLIRILIIGDGKGMQDALGIENR